MSKFDLGITKCHNRYVTGTEEHIENPIWRIRHDNGLSLRRAADKIGCHYQSIYMTEHGMYERVLGIIMDWAVSNSDWDRYRIDDSYFLFKRYRRLLAMEKYGLESLTVGCLGPPGDNPVRQLRRFLDMTQSKFCKELCLPVALLYTAENSCKSLPWTMYNVLKDLRVPDEVVQEMSDRYEEIR